MVCASQLVGDHGPHVELTSEGTLRALHPLTLEDVERIAAEAIRNAVNHAKASHIWIFLHWGRRELTLAIRDDGVGMPASILKDGERTGHFGLVGMRERAERIGGKLEVASRERAGTEVTLTLPVHARYRNDRGSLLGFFRDRWNGRRHHE
ncbi:MAG: ATP-binding protein [Sphingomonas sp.]